MGDLRSHDVGHEVGGGVDVAVGGGLEEAAGVDVVLADEIRDRAGDLDQPIDRPGGERATRLDEVGEGALAEAVELAGGALDGGRHLGVAAQVPRAQADELAIAGGDDAGANRGGGLAGFAAAQLCERDGTDVDVEVDAIEERAGEALPVTLDCAGAAGAFAGARVEPAARARVGRGDEQERGGELEGAVDAIDRDGALLELAQSLDRRARELGELVEEQDAVVGERDLAGYAGWSRRRSARRWRSCDAGRETVGCR